ncbi:MULTISPECIES: hypothetical protein [Arthrobacter]|uniref:Uncharacterized protein n=1 Tax=Arthrobacter terricola TaxID=2547396 RepID=A0A4R5L1U4_9MICC|nr:MULTISPECIES: hypothetical protein [Arthrobacter]MBT8159505.1 hypothetical protein [Arthrobacter sp. GN70]TDG01361.1 hypothetical protein E1809_02330 [Arthrobacter terricola]
MTGAPWPLRPGRYWPVLLLDISAVTVLLVLALALPAGPWWWILVALWTGVAVLRALNEHQSRARDHP